MAWCDGHVDVTWAIAKSSFLLSKNHRIFASDVICTAASGTPSTKDV